MSIEKLKEFNRELVALQEKHRCWLKAKGELLVNTEDDDNIYRVGGYYDGLDIHMDLDVYEQQGHTIELWGYGPRSLDHPGNKKG